MAFVQYLQVYLSEEMQIIHGDIMGILALQSPRNQSVQCELAIEYYHCRMLLHIYYFVSIIRFEYFDRRYHNIFISEIVQYCFVIFLIISILDYRKNIMNLQN